MSSVIYAIVFSGQIVEGFQPISVKAHMAKMLKVDAEKMAVLFSGKQVVLKRTADKQEAIKYGTALKKVGADVKIKAIKTEAAPAQPAEAQSPAAAASAAPDAASSLALAPNEGYLVEPKPAAPAPQVDISGLELAENDDTPLAPTKPQEAIELNLSEYSIGDMDDTPLVEPAPAVPKLDAPDFGLDDPGAVLETLKDELPPVNPDISGLSLAPVGEDLVTAAEKSPAPAPQVPDTSNLQLVPNFD